ncbi:hypothetical protein A2382_03435 [Candidatus Woesebacteria bacterium RIFOXYB1_FULL_38_16]|uniref:DNA-3-methyladenine glycosylase II n=1 Tax=Candidatus Woesebacteria bacterium RIFOXYB1_FULL_38_16 TaxID=1802538 RepID=A0A1F8CSW2_9BACT|nr:MAG: hypothetical protein A2191_03720 [Candidatus Woesebacteria bacterium RIFOXYA1_FULL_38_9]OGM78919.1 MAG: hypothetical protein A2382_03435 [Candidatus Woesebacteria bacterium RIFOXYB1_FULL_38_16]
MTKNTPQKPTKPKDKYQEIKNHFQGVDLIIYQAMKNIDFDQWFIPKKHKQTSESYFQSLCSEIIGQQLSGASANAINTRFKSLFPKNKIAAEKLLLIKDKKLREIGLSWAKASYVKNIAKAYLDKSVRFNDFEKMKNKKIISELTTIKGVGPWTAEMFLIFTLGRKDVFSSGDLGLKKGLLKLYKLDQINKETADKITKIWKPYRSFGSITLWHSLTR